MKRKLFMLLMIFALVAPVVTPIGSEITGSPTVSEAKYYKKSFARKKYNKIKKGMSKKKVKKILGKIGTIILEQDMFGERYEQRLIEFKLGEFKSFCMYIEFLGGKVYGKSYRCF